MINDRHTDGNMAIVIANKLLEQKKQALSMVVTLLGIITDAKLLQEAKA